MADPIESTDVGVPSASYMAMEMDWTIVRDLMGGTESMRLAKTAYLPQEEKEEDDQYDRRISRSFLYEALADTVKKLISRPFGHPVTLKGDLPQLTAKLETNADRLGLSLTGFAKQLLADAIPFGLSHILVDAPAVSEELNLQQQRAKGISAYLTHLKHDQLIGWKHKIDEESGELTLQQIRWTESVDVEDGPYKTATQNRVRVMNAPIGEESGTWETWIEVSSAAGQGKLWNQIDSGEHDFKEIPLFTLYTEKTGQLTAKPPLMGLAWLNLAHWQSSSSQRNILAFARVGILFMKGLSPEESKKLSISPNAFLSTENPDGDLKYVEYGGKAIEAGVVDIEQLESRMEILGLQPLVERRAGQTATGKVIDESRTHSDMQSWVRDEETVLTAAIVAAALANAEKIEEAFGVDIFSEFALAARSKDDLDLLLRARIAKEISQETFLSEIKRRAVVSEDMNVEDEIERIDEEEPDLVNAGNTDPSQLNSEEDEDEDDEEA